RAARSAGESARSWKPDRLSTRSSADKKTSKAETNGELLLNSLHHECKRSGAHCPEIVASIVDEGCAYKFGGGGPERGRFPRIFAVLAAFWMSFRCGFVAPSLSFRWRFAVVSLSLCCGSVVGCLPGRMSATPLRLTSAARIRDTPLPPKSLGARR